MQVNPKWHESNDGTMGEHYRLNGIILARIWRRGLDWQAALLLPGVILPRHLFDSAEQARKLIETKTAQWFDKVDA